MGGRGLRRGEVGLEASVRVCLWREPSKQKRGAFGLEVWSGGSPGRIRSCPGAELEVCLQTDRSAVLS